MAEATGGEKSTLTEDARRSLPFSALSGVLQILLSVVGMLLLVRYLSPALYGKWMVLVSFGTPIVLFTALGLRHSLLRFIPAQESEETKSRNHWSVLFRRFVVVLLVCIGLHVVFPLFASRIGVEGLSEVLALLLPGFLFLSMSQYLIVGLNAGFRQREVFIGSVVFQSTAVLGVVVGINMEAGLQFFAGAQLLAYAVYLLFNWIAAVRYLGGPKWQDCLRGHEEVPEERNYRRASFADDLGNSFLSADINRFILAAFSTSTQVAIYAVASSIVERLKGLMPLEIFRPLATVVFFKRYEEAGTIQEVNRMFHLLFAVNRIATTAFLVLFAPLGYEAIVWVFRLDYGSSYLPVLVLLLGIGLFGMPIGLVAQTLRRPKWLVYSKLAVLLNVGLGVPLTIWYGATGMAIATALSELLKNLIVYGLLRREFQIRYPWLSTFRFLLAGSVVTLFLWWIQGSVHLLIAGGIGGIAWLVALRLFRVLSADERRLLLTVTPDRFKKGLRILLGA